MSGLEWAGPYDDEDDTGDSAQLGAGSEVDDGDDQNAGAKNLPDGPDGSDGSEERR